MKVTPTIRTATIGLDGQFTPNTSNAFKFDQDSVVHFVSWNILHYLPSVATDTYASIAAGFDSSGASNTGATSVSSYNPGWILSTKSFAKAGEPASAQTYSGSVNFDAMFVRSQTRFNASIDITPFGPYPFGPMFRGGIVIGFNPLSEWLNFQQPQPK